MLIIPPPDEEQRQIRAHLSERLPILPVRLPAADDDDD